MAKKAAPVRKSKNGGSTPSLYERTNVGAEPAPEERGSGGELHQIAADELSTLTTQQGIPVADDQNTLRVGARGPALLEDFHFREDFHFDHERIPERGVVHARGYGAHGFSS
jgi:catalase